MSLGLDNIIEGDSVVSLEQARQGHLIRTLFLLFGQYDQAPGIQNANGVRIPCAEKAAVTFTDTIAINTAISR
jgi:hypothetical protein